MSDLELTEGQKRALALDLSLCVTAGAGAGKTRVLVERYLRLLESGVKVSQILALTFTEKAAAEMKEKVRKAISEKKGPEWEERLDEFNWCSISTFHSFCANLIRQYPLLSGVAPRFQVLDDIGLSLMQEEVFGSLLSGECDCEASDSLIRTLTWYGSVKTRERLEYMYEHRAEMAEWLDSHSDVGSVMKWAEEIDELILRETVDRALSNDLVKESLLALSDLADSYSGQDDPGQRYLTEAGPIIKRLMAAKTDGEKLQLLRSLSKMPGRRGMGSKKIFTGDSKERLTVSFDAIKTMFEDTCLEKMACGNDKMVQRTAESTFDLINVYRSYSARMAEAKKKSNAIDFSDMIATAMMLVGRDDVVSSLRGRYRNLLVDEFQDTDPIQSSIVWAVAGEDPEDRLFIVGDPRQSIYGFRSADVAMFKESKRRMVKKDPKADVQLDMNFRSSRQVVDVVNYVFSRLMVDEDREYRFKYEPMSLSEVKSKDAGSVELILPGSSTVGSASLSEPEMVAARIQQIIGQGEKKIHTDKNGKRLEEGRCPEYGDVTILLRARTQLKMFEKALRDRNIPYHVHKGLGFFERQEVMDVYNILRFMADSSDDVSAYGILRSPYFAFSDEELFFICRSRGFDIWSRLRKRAEEDGRCKMAVDLLESWLSRAGQMSVVELLRFIQMSSGISAVYAAQTNSAQLLANLDKLTSLLRGASADGICMPHEAVKWMENAMELAKLEGEAPMGLSANNAVNIMTVHASKGLEFPIVIVPELSGVSRGPPNSMLFDSDIGLGMTILGEDYKLAKNAALSLIERVEDEKDAEESKRLLYVAMTRAMDHLVLSGKIGTSGGETITWMKLLRSAVAPDGITPEVRSVPIIGETTIDIVREGDMNIGGLERNEPVLMSLPDGIEDLVDWSAIPHPKRRFGLTVTGLEAFESYPDRFIRRNVFGVPEGWLESGARSDAMLFGTASHEVLQGRDPKTVAMKYGLSESRITDLIDIHDLFLASKGEGGTAYRELKFAADLNGQRFEGKVDRLEIPAKGVSMVVDFKTDAVKDGGEEKSASGHTDQLRAYALMMSGAMHGKVQGQVYFTGSGKYVNIGEDAGFETGLKDRIRECSEQVNKGVER